MMVKTQRKSWVMRLPRGVREQPGWVFIGALTSITGLSYFLGIAQSTAISRVLGSEWQRGWGGFLFVAGSLVAGSTITRNKPLERLSLRFLSVGFLVYMGWVLTAAPLDRAMVSVATCVSLIISAEIRAAVIKVSLRPLPIIIQREADQ